MFQVKNFYLSGSRTGGYKLTVHRFGLTDHGIAAPPATEGNYATDDLIHELEFGENWADRAKAAQLLSDRRVKGVPDGLLKARDNDSHLEVVRDAVRAFGRITGYEPTDIFGEGADAWWDEHKNEVTATLADK